jgi:hypothetical protein
MFFALGGSDVAVDCGCGLGLLFKIMGNALAAGVLAGRAADAEGHGIEEVIGRTNLADRAIFLMLAVYRRVKQGAQDPRPR